MTFVDPITPSDGESADIFKKRRVKTMSDDEFEIYFDDLTPGAKKELLKFFNASGPEKLNWDNRLIPIACIPKPESDSS